MIVRFGLAFDALSPVNDTVVGSAGLLGVLETQLGPCPTDITPDVESTAKFTQNNFCVNDGSKGKYLIDVVARGGIEPPTRGFSVRWTPPPALSFNDLPGRPLPTLPHCARLCGTDSRKTPAAR
jgi:hypothetical protein